MKPRPTTIQPGATHWNPNTGPDWYCARSDDTFDYLSPHLGWIRSSLGNVTWADLIPVDKLMAQPPEWNGEGLPPVGAVIEVRRNDNDWYRAFVVAHDNGRVVYRCDYDMTAYGWTIGNGFRPIKSERDKAIEEMRKVMSNACKVSGPTDPKDICVALYDAGYRRVGR